MVVVSGDCDRICKATWRPFAPRFASSTTAFVRPGGIASALNARCNVRSARYGPEVVANRARLSPAGQMPVIMLGASPTLTRSAGVPIDVEKRLEPCARSRRKLPGTLARLSVAYRQL